MSRNSKPKLNRKYSERKENKIIFIFTEGTKTEPNYFESKKKEIEEEIRRKNIKIEVKGTACNTESLVDYAINFIGKEKIDLDIDECWVVFDKDSFDKHFNAAINKATANNLKTAYSNQSFELWLLLHFIPLVSALDNDTYIKKLTDNIRKQTGDKKIKYTKALDVYSIVFANEKEAIKRAKKLLTENEEEPSFLKRNPCTTVHLLVESLNNLKIS